MSRIVKVATWGGKARASVVFVHGLGGHAYGTWWRAADDGSFWPVWLAEDVEGLLGLLGGLTLVAFGLAVLGSARYPAWLGAIGLLDGLGMAAAGAAQAATGFSGSAMALSMVSSSVFLAWAVLAGVLMRRWAARPGGEGDAA